MDMLFAGILLWSAVHYIPSLMPALKVTLVEKLGNGYRGVFTQLGFVNGGPLLHQAGHLLDPCPIRAIRAVDDRAFEDFEDVSFIWSPNFGFQRLYSDQAEKQKEKFQVFHFVKFLNN